MESWPGRNGGDDLKATIGCVAFAAVVLVVLLVVLPAATPSRSSSDAGPRPQATVVPQEMNGSLSDLARAVRDGRVRSIELSGNDVRATLRDGGTLLSRKEPDAPLVQTLASYGINSEQLAALDIRIADTTGWSWLGSLLWLLPVFGLLILLLVWRPGGVRGGTDQVIDFARSRARRVTADRPTTRFADVAGVDEAKEELQEIVQFLRYPAKFARLGARVPKGVLLVGPPGTGKTLLARAVAGEAGVPFFSISGSEFVEMFVGVGAARVRDLFKQAKDSAPCIIFIDEIDAVGRQRGTGLGGGHDEREQTLNQILVEMDGFDTQTNVIVVAATNRPDILDPALLRPGRFDRQVVLDAPDVRGREAILQVHARGKVMGPDVDLSTIARETPGFSGADLENVLNEAALLAARRGSDRISLHEIEEAIDRIVAGPERKSRLIGDRDRQIIAYHEAGHAVVAHHLPNADPVHKVTIVARGMSGGHTRLLPAEDHTLWTRSQLSDVLAYALGGLVAEELVFGETTTGPGNDLQRATETARKMVAEYGMSDKIGPVALIKKDEMTFLGRDLVSSSDYSPDTARLIDAETRRLIDEAHRRAHAILVQYRRQLNQVAARLMEHETIEGEELHELLEAA